LGEAINSVSNVVSGTVDNVTNKISAVSDALLGENQLELFDNPQMNALFNKLSADKKASIIKMDEAQRQSVMSQIMAAAQAQQIQQSGGGLTSYFNSLPVQNQIAALQNTYKNISNEFKQLSGVVNAPQITIVKPHSAAEALYGGSLKLLAPEDDKKTDVKDNDNSSSSSDSSSSGSSSSDISSQSGSGGIKIVKV